MFSVDPVGEASERSVTTGREEGSGGDEEFSSLLERLTRITSQSWRCSGDISGLEGRDKLLFAGALCSLLPFFTFLPHSFLPPLLKII